MEGKKRLMGLGLLGLGVVVPLFILNHQYFSIEWFISLNLLPIAGIILYVKKYIRKRDIAIMPIIFILLTIANSFYYAPSYGIARGSGPILNDNWFNGLNWIEQNTDECATIATYWDPGHFIRAIAKRTVIFDGGSQNAVLRIPTDKEDGTEIIPYDNGIFRIIQYKDGERITARIQDVAVSMLTNNETLALEILKDYRKSGCDELYFLATGDLIGKSTWWSYFSTWSPEKEGSKGDRYFYSLLQLAQTRDIPSQNALSFIYPAGQNQNLIIYDTDGDLSAYLQQGNQFLAFARIFYTRDDGQSIITSTSEAEAEVDSLVWLDSSRQLAVIIPPELEDAMFTKMFFFNGFGLENFELVQSWGGEVKLFKINFPDDENQQ